MASMGKTIGITAATRALWQGVGSKLLLDLKVMRQHTVGASRHGADLHGDGERGGKAVRLGFGRDLNGTDSSR